MSPAQNLNQRGLSRRTVIVWGGAGAAAAATVGLVGCSTGTGTDTDTGSAPAGTGSAPSDTDTPTEIATLADIPVGGSIVVEVDGEKVVLSQPESGTVTAFSAVCTHQGCIVAPKEKELACPCHGSRFNAETGEVIEGPAARALAAVAVTVNGTSVMTA